MNYCRAAKTQEKPETNEEVLANDQDFHLLENLSFPLWEKWSEPNTKIILTIHIAHITVHNRYIFAIAADISPWYTDYVQKFYPVWQALRLMERLFFVE